ncbi:hypothetical protein ACNTMW_30610 [Planosporangium sp. 12N6]|uniref:hypothetical protein n=1 Tax=Planosporangium spinosum TaxID=3402278 RepID=UPI003CF2282B
MRDDSGVNGPGHPRGGPPGTVRVTVRGLTLRCWSCGRPTTVVVGLHPAAATTADRLVACDDESTLGTAARLLHAAGRYDVAAPVKVRSSRAAGGDHLSNGCQHCDTLQSGHFVFADALPDVLSVAGLDGLDHLVDVDLPAAEWRRLRGDA